MTTQETIEKATDWMEDTAKDNSHGYDQTYRWGQKGDYDCSAAVITAWEKAGVDLKADGATYTGNLVQALLKNGFEDITSQVNLSNGKGLKRGDILFAKGHHVAMYSGGSLEVEASINEKGKATGGKPGDQTGREFLIRKYRNYPWTNAYRYVGDGKSDTTANKSTESSEPDYRVNSSTGLNLRRKPQSNAEIMLILKDKTKLYVNPDKTTENGFTPVIYKKDGLKYKGYVQTKWIVKV